MLTKVVLDGELGKIAGRKVWMLDINSASEAIALISANTQGRVLNWLRANIQKYNYYEVECETENGTKEHLNDETYRLARKPKEIRFSPIFVGAGGDNGLIQMVVGAIMVVIGVLTSWTGVGASIGVAGIGMILGAICTMIMAPSGNDDDDDGDGSSYYFNGAVNTTKQGVPVPLIFGRCRVGSAVVSAEISISDR